MKQSKDLLTKANIQRIDDTLEVRLHVSLSNIIESVDKPYLLVIQSETEKSIRITVYPINKEKILKISLYGSSVPEKALENMIKIVQNYDIIHSSGLCLKKNQLLYECYLNLNLSELKSENLKTSLDKIRNMFKEIIIEEIG